MPDGKPYSIRGANGETKQIPDGEWYVNMKARCLHAMRDERACLDARVDAYLELHSMGFRREWAVLMEPGGAIRDVQPIDIAKALDVPPRHVRRALEALEARGRCKRAADDDNSLRRGHLRIYCWAEPKAETAEMRQRAAAFPAWLTDSYPVFSSFLKRTRRTLLDGNAAARDRISDLEEAEKRLREAINEAARVADLLCAKPQSGAANRKKETTEKKEGSAAAAFDEKLDTVEPASNPEPAPHPAAAAKDENQTPSDKRWPLFLYESARKRLTTVARQAVPEATEDEIADFCHEHAERALQKKDKVGFLFHALRDDFREWRQRRQEHEDEWIEMQRRTAEWNRRESQPPAPKKTPTEVFARAGLGDEFAAALKKAETPPLAKDVRTLAAEAGLTVDEWFEREVAAEKARAQGAGK